jgi:hypothetical protein
MLPLPMLPLLLLPFLVRLVRLWCGERDTDVYHAISNTHAWFIVLLQEVRQAAAYLLAELVAGMEDEVTTHSIVHTFTH